MKFLDIGLLGQISGDFFELAPILILVVAGAFILLNEAFFPKEEALYSALLSLWGLVASAVSVIRRLPLPPARLFGGMLVIDSFALFLHLLLLVSGGVTILLASRFFRDEKLPSGEFCFFLLFAIAGMMLLVSSADLFVLYLALEIFALGVYVLVGYQSKDSLAIESSLKYFILGAFSSGFLLYGIALLLAATGTVNLQEISYFLQGGVVGGMFWVALIFLFIGFGFKVAAVPFHMWVPDVYEGAPTAITSFMATAVKIAAFGALIRVFQSFVLVLNAGWSTILWWGATLTMTVGNIAALRQKNLKRMLAYSSIAHAGYLLIAVLAMNTLTSRAEALASVLFYLSVYLFMSIGAFSVLIVTDREGREGVALDDFTGFSFKHPFLGAAFALFLLSLAGIPLTAGFMGKFLVFKAGVTAGHVGLVVVAVLNSALSLYYYLRPVGVMYMKGETSLLAVYPSHLLKVAVLLPAIGTLLLGVFPSALLELAQFSVKSLLFLGD